MTSAVASDSNVFQKYLIPSKSKTVRALMHQAGEWGEHENFLFARAASVACVGLAVIFSAFNVFSYALAIPFKMVLRVVKFKPLKIFSDLIEGITNIVRSVFFIFMGLALGVSAIFAPGSTLAHFSPKSSEPEDVRLRRENSVLKNEVELLTKDNQRLKTQNERLKRNAGCFGRCCSFI